MYDTSLPKELLSVNTLQMYVTLAVNLMSLFNLSTKQSCLSGSFKRSSHCAGSREDLIYQSIPKKSELKEKEMEKKAKQKNTKKRPKKKEENILYFVFF